MALSLLSSIVMNREIYRKVLLVYAGIVLCLMLYPREYRAGAQQLHAPSSSAAITAFQDRVRQYMQLHEQAVKKLPKPSKESKPDKIEIYQEGLAELIRGSRVNAKQGEIFTPDIAAHIRSVIKSEFKGARLKELRSTVTGADTPVTTVRVNYPYPETKELVEMPPTLLLKLPELPKQLGYHYAGRRLLLIDREARIIVDYLTDALP
jgi:hypothetical protein